MYIYQNSDWPNFNWDKEKVLEVLAKAKLQQGLLLGKMGAIGFKLKEEAVLNILTQDIIKSSEIEGENLDKEQVRSSVAKRLGLEVGGGVNVDRNIESIVEMMLDATQKYNEPLTINRLLGWQASLFPTGISGMHRINVGQFRDDKNGPMQVVSGAISKEKIHYQAPDANSLDKETEKFLEWFNSLDQQDGIIKAGIAHLWFVTLHPFEDGNGRIARAITDMLLARTENTSQRFYSMSAQIRKERNDYYNILEKTQKGNIDITNWLVWFIECLIRALENTQETLSCIFAKSIFWQKYADHKFNERQKKIINKLFDNFEGKLTSSKWAKICKCSQDSANRDIADLVETNILIKVDSGRSTNYRLKDYEACGD